MKLILFFLICLGLTGCIESHPESAVATFDLSKCVIKGNHAYVPIGIRSRNYPQYIFTAVQQFEEKKGVKATCFTPDIGQYDDIYGVWINF